MASGFLNKIVASSAQVEIDNSLSGDGSSQSPLGVVNDGHTHDTQYNTKTEIGTLFTNYIIVSSTAPSNPATGQLWLDTSV